MWYRRTITETQDVTFQPALCDVDGYDPEWVPDPSKTFATGVLPGQVGAQPAEGWTQGDIDGSALFEGKAARGQSHRPCAVDASPERHLQRRPEDADHGRIPWRAHGDVGREAMRTDVPGFSWFSQVGSMVSGVFKPRTTGGGSAIKMAPGKPLFLPKDGADGKLLESSGAGAKILEDDAEGNEKRLFDAVGVVKINPADIGSNATGEFFKKLAAPMLAVCDDLRECWGDALIGVVGMCLRLLTTQAARSEGVFLPGASEAQTFLGRFLVPTRHGVRWFDPPFALAWGPYFEPSQQERQSAVGWATQATGNGPVLSLRTVVQEIAPIMGIRDVEAELGALGVATTDSHAKVQEMLGTLVPQASTDPAAAPHAKDPTTALNGAQVSSLQEIVAAVASRQLPRASGVAMMLAAFPIDATRPSRSWAMSASGSSPPRRPSMRPRWQRSRKSTPRSRHHTPASRTCSRTCSPRTPRANSCKAARSAPAVPPQAEQPAADAAPAKDATQ
jgi:hypothetical protein